MYVAQLPLDPSLRIKEARLPSTRAGSAYCHIRMSRLIDLVGLGIHHGLRILPGSIRCELYLGWCFCGYVLFALVFRRSGKRDVPGGELSEVDEHTACEDGVCVNLDLEHRILRTVLRCGMVINDIRDCEC